MAIDFEIPAETKAMRARIRASENVSASSSTQGAHHSAEISIINPLLFARASARARPSSVSHAMAGAFSEAGCRGDGEAAGGGAAGRAVAGPGAGA